MVLVDHVELESTEELEELYDLVEFGIDGKDIDGESESPKVEQQVTQIILRREGESQADYDRRVDSFLSCIRFLENTSYLNEEIERLKKLKTARTNLAKRLKAMVLYRLQMAKIERINTKKHEVKIVTKGGMQPIEVDYDPKEDASLIPEEYLVTNVSYRLDKKAIASDLKSGKKLSWARLLEREEYLSIK